VTMAPRRSHSSSTSATWFRTTMPPNDHEGLFRCRGCT
jgi:hypothetical protein